MGHENQKHWPNVDAGTGVYVDLWNNSAVRDKAEAWYILRKDSSTIEPRSCVDEIKHVYANIFICIEVHLIKAMNILLVSTTMSESCCSSDSIPRISPRWII